jgi:hypothetical protein
MCGAPGASVGANARQWGVESRQGAENSALKNIAPFNRTPFNTSENASILLRLPPDAPPKPRGARAKHSKPSGLAGKNCRQLVLTAAEFDFPAALPPSVRYSRRAIMVG